MASSVANLIQTGQATRITVIAGAGISTSAGIPDFRTPVTGLYAKLAGYEEEERRIAEADLVLVMGTSLKVHPTARMPGLAKDGVTRVLINLEKVGDFGKRPEDICILGGCDEGVRALADALGWREELEMLWREVAPDGAVDDDDNELDLAIEKLRQRMEQAGKISNGHKKMLERHLEAKFASMLPSSVDRVEMADLG